MNAFEICDSLATAFLIAWLIDLELRQRRTVAELAIERQRNSDERIRKAASVLTEPELDALLSSRLGKGP